MKISIRVQQFKKVLIKYFQSKIFVSIPNFDQIHFLSLFYKIKFYILLIDTSKTKRHVYLTQNCKQIEKKPFHIKYPIEVPKNIWLNLQIDLYSFIQGWKGMTFRSLDLFVIQSPCKLRKIFTMKQADPDGSIMGKHGFPIGFEHQNLIIQYQDNSLEASHDSCQMKITSKKATGFSQQSQAQQSQKQQKLTQEKITRAIVDQQNQFFFYLKKYIQIYKNFKK